MKTIILESSTIEGLKQSFDKWITPIFYDPSDTGSTEKEKEIFDDWKQNPYENYYRDWLEDDDADDIYEEPVIHNVQQFVMQIITPNTFNPNQPKVEMNFKLLIIYT